MSSKLPVLVVQYTLTGHIRRTEHWSIAVITNRGESSARIFDVQGNTDSFKFQARDVPNIALSRTYCGGVQVGEVTAETLANLEKWLQQIAIKHNDPKWDCQDWVMDAIRELKMDNRGIIFDGMTERHIREEMKEELEREEMGQDIIHERLKA